MNLWETFNKLNKLYDSKERLDEATSYPAEPLSSSEDAEQADVLLEWKNAPSGKRMFLRKNIKDTDIQKIVKNFGVNDHELTKYYANEIKSMHFEELIRHLFGEELDNWANFEKEFFTDDPLKAEIFDRYEYTTWSACDKFSSLLANYGIWNWWPQEEDKNKDIVRVYPFEYLDSADQGDYVGEFKLTRLRLKYHYELED